MSTQEIKGTLAKLLATENLIVQHDAGATTASFNTATRVLTLPLLNVDSQYVYDMFIGHEVGHALWTPIDWRDHVEQSVPFDYVNVIEDARIEKMIQDKFPGLRRDFSRGYTELNNRNFFEIEGKDLAKLSFIDRINLHFKLGSRAVISFSDEEMVYVRAVEDCDTFEKVCLVSKLIADYMKAKRDQEQQQHEVMIDSPGTGEDEQITNNNAPSTPMDQAEDDDEVGEDETDTEPSQANKDAGDETKSETQRALDKNLEKLAPESHDRINKVTYIETPKHPTNVFPLEFLREDFVTMRAEKGEVLCATDERFNDFMLSIKRDVAFMVQQFEMRKSADAYSRSQINKTGVLDMEKLHQYKLTDDIFLRQTTLPEGKNHGLVMFVDWSGSMSDNIVATVKQLLVLVQFCRKAGIPYDVYTFTNGFDKDWYVEDDERLENQVTHLGHQLTHILTSRCNRRVGEVDMRNIFHQAWKLSYTYSGAAYSHQLSMGGTPLNNVLFAVPEVVTKFKADNKVQKVSFVCLTDGESAPLKAFVKTDYHGCVPGMVNTWGSLFLRDGHQVYKLDPMEQTQSIVSYLMKKLPDVSFTNIFLSGPKGAERYAKYNNGVNYSMDDFKKQGSMSFTTTNSWPLICLVNPSAFNVGSENIQVDAGAGKAKVKAALKKFLKGKSASKVLLTALVGQFS